MLTAFLVVSMTAAPVVAKPVTLALPGLNAVNLAPGESDLQAELIAQKFIAHGVEVKTARDLQTMLGMERQRQLLGCSDNNACIVEMTAALGVDGVLIGDLGLLNGEYVLNLKVLASSSGKVLALHNARAPAKQLEVMLENAVRGILKSLSGPMKHSELAVGVEPLPLTGVEQSAGAVRTWALAPAVVGVAALGAGVVMQVLAGNQFTDLSTHHYPEPEALQRRNDGQQLETGANIALIGGGVAVAAAAVMFFAGGSSVTPTVALGPQGGMIGVTGVLP